MLPGTKIKYITRKHEEWIPCPFQQQNINFRALSNTRRQASVPLSKQKMKFVSTWTIKNTCQRDIGNTFIFVPTSKNELECPFCKLEMDFCVQFDNTKLAFVPLSLTNRCSFPIKVSSANSHLHYNNKRVNFCADSNRKWILSPVRVTENELFLRFQYVSRWIFVPI